MPELAADALYLLRSRLHRQLLRAATALGDERVADEEALALARNAAAAVVMALDPVDWPERRWQEPAFKHDAA